LKLFVVLLVVLALLASTGIIYLTGGTEGRFSALTHLYYIPILASALSLGPVAGVLSALAAAVLGGPMMPANVALHVMQPAGDWLTRALLFILVGIAMGGLTARWRAALRAERRQREQLDMLHEIDKAILADRDLDEFLGQLVEAVGTLLGADVCSVYLIDENSGHLDLGGCWTQAGGLQDGSGDNGEMAYTAAISREVMPIASLACSRREPVICPDLLRDSRYLDPSRPDIEWLGLRSVMAAPLGNGQQGTGALLVGYVDPRQLSREQQTDLARVAHQVAIALKNVRQLEQLSQFGHETLAAFTEAIAQRDLYTGGHVNRIAGFATTLARHLNLSRGEVETIRYAAHLHDIGKLAVPTEILRKPGFLNQQEWDMIEQHPVIGAQIVERVSVLQDVAPLVRHHHERYDGTGYPAGLRGDQIPLGARIIAVVDAFDAMISDRPYRCAMSVREALEELTTESGMQFDPEVVNMFLKLVIAEDNDMSRDQVAAFSPTTWAGNSSVSDVVNDNGQGHMDVE
jgi:putative nucleotidyltransferase with HDIG domain